MICIIWCIILVIYLLWKSIEVLTARCCDITNIQLILHISLISESVFSNYFITCMYSVIVATCTHQISSSNIFYQWIFLSMFRNGVWKYLYSKRMQLSCFSLFFYWGHEMVILNMWWFVNCFLCFSHLNIRFGYKWYNYFCRKTCF